MRAPQFIICVVVIASILCESEIHAKILSICEAAKELRKAGISNTFVSNWVCLMKSESGLDTTCVKGPGAASSYSYGVFQINSKDWCRRGRKGGKCDAKCEDFADDDITNDIACARQIENEEGFKHWKGWMNKCKNKPLPNTGSCKERRRSIADILFSTLNNMEPELENSHQELP